MPWCMVDSWGAPRRTAWRTWQSAFPVVVVTSFLWCDLQVLSKELKEHGYYKKKGVIEKLASKYVGQIRMLDSGDVLQVNLCTEPVSFDLETFGHSHTNYLDIFSPAI